ncbi:uncharacterized protein LOC119649707 [Hermetia illucens]|uniref:uncharacterized protein LOC119649707 n=1 Tax=Hermetia illucens TaxID=343691 RepID=UPI0018CBF4CA|nr:uncharacterized protein LOC119649707 [Hermetia illucens]
MENRALLTLLTVTVVLQITLCAVPKMQLVLTSIEQCKGKEDLPITINHWEIIQREKSSFYLTGIINVTQEFPEGFDVELRVDKCPADARLGNCDTFINNFATKNICYIFEVNQPRAMQIFFNSVEPKLKCPLKPDVYSVKDMKAEQNLIDFLPQMGATSWLVTLIARHNNQEVGCSETTANVHPRRLRG